MIIAAGLVIASASAHDNIFKKQREDLIENYRFPDGLDHKIKKEYLALNDDDIRLILRGLRDYFQICRMAQNRMVSMPSKAVDAAWHEFILFTGYYRQFCQQAFGRFLDHTPA